MRQQLAGVGAQELRRVAARGGERLLDARDALRLVGPDEGAQEERRLLRTRIERVEVDPYAPPDLDLCRERAGGERCAQLPLERQRRVLRSPLVAAEAVAVAVPEEVEASARPKLDEVDPPARLPGE